MTPRIPDDDLFSLFDAEPPADDASDAFGSTDPFDADAYASDPRAAEPEQLTFQGANAWIPLKQVGTRGVLNASELRAVLGSFGFLDGDGPSDLARKHGFAMREGAAALWHEDVLKMISAWKGSGAAARPAQAAPAEGASPDANRAESNEDAGARGRGGVVENVETKPSAPATKAGRGPIGRPDQRYDHVIATDGSCSGNPGPGGWAWVDQKTGQTGAGGESSTTNNRMELTALLRALEHAGPDGSLLIRSDSMYVINSMTKWAPGWKKKGWKKADGKPVLNLDIIKPLFEMFESRDPKPRFDWVKGHNGDAANELADALAVEQTEKHSR